MTWQPSVRTRHLLVAVGLTLLAVCSLSFFHATRLLTAHLAAKRELATIVATQIFKLAQEAVFRPPQQEPQEAISNDAGVRALLEAGTQGASDFAYLVIVSQEGRIIAQSDPQELRAQAAQKGLRLLPLETLEQQRWYHKLWSLRRGNRIYEISISISFRKQPFGQIVAGIPAPRLWEEVRGPLQLLLIVALTTAALLMLIALVTSNFVPRALQEPLQELLAEINQIENEYTALQNALQAHGPRTSGALREAPSRNLQSATQRLRELSRRFADNRSEIEAMRDQFSQVINNLSERMVLLDRERRVMMASPEAERLLTPTLREGVQSNGVGTDGRLRGRLLAEALGANHPLGALLEQAFSQCQSAEQTLTLPGDPPQTVVASVQVFADHQQPAGALLVLRDFESIKRLETQLDYATRIAALSRITSGVAHEVKNPLHAMVLHLELLRTKLAEGRDPAKHVEVLTTEVNRLNRVVQTFLDFTRPVEVQMRKAELNDLVHDVVLLAPVNGMRDGEHRINVVESYAGAPIFVEADGDLLKQALLNIVVNACQAMPDGGQLTITTEHIGKNQAQITIADQGVGIPEEVREKIFNLYFTTKPQGSGIGLAQAFRAVQLHSGRIEVESQVGVGTTFRITLPTVSV